MEFDPGDLVLFISVTHYITGGATACGLVNIDCQTGDGEDYIGPVDTTQEGYKCEVWNVQDKNTSLRFWGHNHCRSPQLCKPVYGQPKIDVPCDGNLKVGLNYSNDQVT